MVTTTGAGLADRLRDATRACTDVPALAEAVFRAVGRHVAFDFACFATTDPATGLITGAVKSSPLGVGDEEFAVAEYGGPDVNTFAEIAQRVPPVGALDHDTGGHPETCRRHRELMAPRFGFSDELRVVLASRGAPWGALALYRGAGGPAFTPADAEQLGPASAVVAEAVQQVLFRRRAPSAAGSAAGSAGEGPAVLVVDGAGAVAQLTPAAQAAVEELGGWDCGSLPANALAVVATTRARQEATTAQVRGRSGRWLTLRAAPLTGPCGSGDVVVTVDPAPRTSLSRLVLVAHGLTAREEEVALLVLQGADTRAIAGALHLSPWTVQDHLKTVFTKLGVTSRREMTARLVLD